MSFKVPNETVTCACRYTVGYSLKLDSLRCGVVLQAGESAHRYTTFCHGLRRIAKLLVEGPAEPPQHSTSGTSDL